MIIAFLLVLLFGAVCVAFEGFADDSIWSWSRLSALKKERQRRIKLGYDK